VPGRLVATADKLAVDLPLTVTALEPEGASDARRIEGVREAVEVGARWNVRRVDAVVGYRWTVDDDLEDLRSLTSAKNVARGTSAVVLLQTILEIESLAGFVREIDDHVDALRHREA